MKKYCVLLAFVIQKSAVYDTKSFSDMALTVAMALVGP